MDIEDVRGRHRGQEDDEVTVTASFREFFVDDQGMVAVATENSSANKLCFTVCPEPFHKTGNVPIAHPE